MAPRRVRPPTKTVRITLDGRPIEADAEASLAAALVAEGEWALARSPKFHRPRGPSCLRGGCDGCLMRVDDVPNVMTCLVPAKEGTRVERQNVVLSSKVDVLRATDWFFPHGMNHHEMFAGVPGVQTLMQAFARRLSGLGELPDAAAAPRGPMRTEEVDVLVVGAGAAGLSVGRALKARGRSVILCDDQRAPGGGARGFSAFDTDKEAATVGESLRLRTTAIGVLEGGDWLLAGPEALCRVVARAHVLATGAHDATPGFLSNDLPGVVSARAALTLLAQGVLVGMAPIVVGDGPHAREFVRRAGELGADVRRVHAVTAARGLSQVKGAKVLEVEGGPERKVDGDAIVHDDPPAPSFELAVQAGGRVSHGPAGYAVEVDGAGRVVCDNPPFAPLFAIGEATGAPFDPAGFAAFAVVLGATVHDALLTIEGNP